MAALGLRQPIGAAAVPEDRGLGVAARAQLADVGERALETDTGDLPVGRTNGLAHGR